MPKEKINQELRLKNKYEMRNYLVEKINRHELMSKRHAKLCSVLNYIDHSLVATSTITGCVSISAFASLVGIPIRIASSKIGLKICVMTPGIKSIINRKRKMHNKIELLTKSNLNSMELLMSKAVIDSNISHEKFVLINDVLDKFCDMK